MAQRRCGERREALRERSEQRTAVIGGQQATQQHQRGQQREQAAEREPAQQRGLAADRRGEDAREIVDGAKRAWPIRNILPQPVESAPALDSHESAAPAK